jgi:hypothetical protein
MQCVNDPRFVAMLRIYIYIYIYIYNDNDNNQNQEHPFGGGLEYLHRRQEVTKREPSARGYTWATLFLGDINTGTWPSRLGESQMRQENMTVSSEGLRPKSDCSGKAQKQL